MRAAYLTGCEEVVVREAPDPQIPDDGLVLRVMACGVCGSDVRRWRQGPASGSPPQVPGHEVSGVVSAVGLHAHGYGIGDRLAVAADVHCGECYYCRRGRYNLCDDLQIVGVSPQYPGGFAEQLALSGRVLSNGIVHRLPDGLTHVAGALAEPLASVLAAHRSAQTTLGDRVAVIGAGPIGCLHVAVAHRCGAQVLVSQRSAPRRALAERFHPEVIVDPTEQDIVSAALSWTNGLGADVAICANPVAATQDEAVRLVRKGGRVVFFGGLPHSSPWTRLDANRIHYGEIAVLGSFSYHPSMHELALQLLAQGIVDPSEMVTHTFALEQVAQAFATAAKGEGLKAMVFPNGMPAT